MKRLFLSIVLVTSVGNIISCAMQIHTMKQTQARQQFLYDLWRTYQTEKCPVGVRHLL